MIKGITEGRIVHFVTDNGKHRPAIIVQVWDKDSGMSNLQVFLDGTNDARENFTLEQLKQGLAWVGSAHFDDSEKPNPRTWHFPEQV